MENSCRYTCHCRREKSEVAQAAARGTALWGNTPPPPTTVEQQSRSKTTHTTKDQDAKKTSSIKPVHALGLLALNPAPPSTSSSPFSTPSVADSVEFTETNPAAVMEKEAPVSEQQAPVDSGMPDTVGASQTEEISKGGNFALFMAQVCLSFFSSSRTSFRKSCLPDSAILRLAKFFQIRLQIKVRLDSNIII